MYFPLHQTHFHRRASYTEDKSQHTNGQLTQISLQPFFNEHQILTRATIRLKSHIPVSCPSTATVGTSLLCCAPFVSPLLQESEGLGEITGTSTDNPHYRRMSSNAVSEGLTVITPVPRSSHHGKGRSPGAVDESPPASPLPSIFYINQQAGDLAPRREGSFHSQQTPSLHDYNFNLLN